MPALVATALAVVPADLIFQPRENGFPRATSRGDLFSGHGLAHGCAELTVSAVPPCLPRAAVSQWPRLMEVFLSYAHTAPDQALALYVAARLRAAGIDVWMDRSSLNAGQPTRQAIQAAVARC